MEEQKRGLCYSKMLNFKIDKLESKLSILELALDEQLAKNKELVAILAKKDNLITEMNKLLDANKTHQKYMLEYLENHID